MSERLTGGCACERVQFEAEVESYDAYLCHCRMCQRASGNVSLAMIGVEQAGVTWSREPDWYRSSPIAERPYCAACGTSLGFRYLDGTTKMDLTVASFDDPARVHPTSHFGAESIHEAWLDTTAVPRARSDQYDKLVDRWKAVGEAPR